MIPTKLNLIKGNPFRPYTIPPKFTNLGIIGSGDNWELYKLGHKETNKVYALKRYINIFRDRELALKVLREVVILRRIKNERIIKIYDILPLCSKNFNSVILILEYLPLDLVKPFLLKDENISKIIYQLLVGLKYLKHVNILYRDLNFTNILVDREFNIKIYNFAAIYEQTSSFTQASKLVTLKQYGIHDTSLLSPFSPTLKKTPKVMVRQNNSRWHRAPELILMQTKYDCIQIWAVILKHEKNKNTPPIYSYRRPLFGGKACFPMSPPKTEDVNLYKLNNGFPYSEDDQICKILQVIGSPAEDQLDFIEDQLALNYVKSLPKYPKKKIAQLFHYCKPEWEDFLNKILVFDPRKRLTIDEALRQPLFDEIRNEKDYQFEGSQNFENLIPNDMSIEKIREKLIEEITIYQDGFNMTDDQN